MMSLSSVLQVAILATGIYVVLGFLRTTRGSGLVRGLAFALVGGVVGLSAFAEQLQLEELDYILEIITGYVVVILAILFQPELRRGIVQLGENPLVGRLLEGRRHEVVTEVSQACISMAKKRQGALIAFERKTALDTFIDGAVRVDSEVNRFLVDSIFHHGSALHDGAIILRGDRIEAAACLFPLTENIEISKSTGTRHRAALGLTEETDAVTVAISEETGGIAVCKSGEMQRNVPPARLEEILRESIGSKEKPEGSLGSDASGGLLRWSWSLLSENLWLKSGSLVIAGGLFWVAHQDIRREEFHALRVRVDQAVSIHETESTIYFNLSNDHLRLAMPTEGTQIRLKLGGSRAQLDALPPTLNARYDFGTQPAIGRKELSLNNLVWTTSSVEDLQVNWDGLTPIVVIEATSEKTIKLAPEHVKIISESLDPRYQAAKSELRFTPTQVSLIGPSDVIDTLGDTLPLRLAPLTVPADQRGDLQADLTLHPDLIAQGFAFSADREHVVVHLPIAPIVMNLREISIEIVLISTDPNRKNLKDKWLAPAQEAVLEVRTRGVIPDLDANSSAYQEKVNQVRQWVKKNYKVVVDVATIEPDSNYGR
ncbi:MAG: diadenylate cyclase, partial [Planctomycetota bacterium]